MSIRKRGRRAYQVRVPPFPAVTVPTKEAAEQVELDLKMRKSLGPLYVEKPTRLGDEIDGFLDRKRTLGGKRGPLRPAGMKFYEVSLRPWEPLRRTLLPTLSRRMVEDIIVARARERPTSARNELEVLKSVLRAAESRGQRIDVSILDIPPIRVTPREGRALEPAELYELAAHFPEHVKRIIPFVGFVGLRFTEALALADEHVDFAAARVTIPGRLTKNRKTKAIDLAATEVQLLREQTLARAAGASHLFATRRGRRYSASSFREHVLWPALTAAGYRTEERGKGEWGDLVFHDLRHTAISLQARAGIPAEVIAERVGHTDGGALIRRRYRHLYDGEAASRMPLLDALIREQTGTAMDEKGTGAS